MAAKKRWSWRFASKYRWRGSLQPETGTNDAIEIDSCYNLIHFGIRRPKNTSQGFKIWLQHYSILLSANRLLYYFGLCRLYFATELTWNTMEWAKVKRLINNRIVWSLTWRDNDDGYDNETAYDNDDEQCYQYSSPVLVIRISGSQLLLNQKLIQQ